MSESNLMICMTCKKVQWVDDDLLHEYIGEHISHHFHILPESILESQPLVEAWFIGFMGWPAAVEE